MHQIWNDETWIRYHTIQNQMGMVDLTEEQEEELFPDVPDYIVVDGKVYEPDVASHLENYGRQVDGCSFFRIELEEVMTKKFSMRSMPTSEKTCANNRRKTLRTG